MVEYRHAEGDDINYDEIVAVAHAIEPDEYVSAADLRDWKSAQDRAGRMCVRWLAYIDDTIVGSAYVGESPWFDRTMMIVHVMVHPDHQHQGHGRTLLEHAETTASDRGGERLISWTRETRSRAIRFLERAGFHENDRSWQSTLDLDGFDPTAWQGTVDRITSTGIRIVPISTLSTDRPEWKRDLHRLYAELEADTPTRFSLLPVPFEDFDSLSLGRRLLADGFLVAMDGEHLIGLTEPLLVDDEPTAIAQELTGVRSDYRGRGIATALKATSATWAKSRGYISIRTENAQSNAPMLAVNDRLGFERDHAQIEYLKNL